MPAQVLPSAEAFKKFEEKMLEKGFRKLGRSELRSDFKRLGLEAPRPREGREVGFTFHANGLTAVVWTTYLEEAGEARQEDAGWVLIKEGDTPRYFSHPIHRTKGFLCRLYKWAQVNKQRVEKRPLCPTCQAFMSIVPGPALKARYWECDRALRHPDHKKRTVMWDKPLSEGARRFVLAERQKRASGSKPTGAAMLKRKSWSINRAENQL